MKNLRSFLLLLLLLPGAATAQTIIKEKEVPPAVLNDFRMRFPYAEEVVWIQEGQSVVGARFEEEHAKCEAVYKADGEWVQSQREITFRELPDSAAGYCRSEYGDLKLDNVQRVTTRRYGVLYDVVAINNLEKLTLTFDVHGKLVDTRKEALHPDDQKATAPEPGTPQKKNLGQMLRLKQ